MLVSLGNLWHTLTGRLDRLDSWVIWGEHLSTRLGKGTWLDMKKAHDELFEDLIRFLQRELTRDEEISSQ